MFFAADVLMNICTQSIGWAFFSLFVILSQAFLSLPARLNRDAIPITIAL